MKRSLFICTFCLIAANVFSYHAPLGTKIATVQNTFDKVYFLEADNLNSIPAGSNCFAFVMKMNIVDRDYGRVFSIRNRNTGVTLLSIDFNNSGRIAVNRPFGKGVVSYEIYDKLLNYSNTAGNQYEFRIFLSGTFIWIEVTNSSNVSVTPLFWGINLPEINLINRIVNRDSAYEFLFGDPGNRSSLVRTDFEVYALKYVDLKNDIINNYIPSTQTRAAILANVEEKEDSNDEIKLYPLPVSDELNVDFHLKDAGEVDFEFYTIQGTLLYKSREKYSSAGDYHKYFSKEKIGGNSGITILQIRINDKVITRKVLFQ